MALNGLNCAAVPLRIYSLTHPRALCTFPGYVWAMIRRTLRRVQTTGQSRCGNAAGWTAGVLLTGHGTHTTSREDRSRLWRSATPRSALLPHLTVVLFTCSGNVFTYIAVVIWWLASDRQHLSYDVCLEVRGEIISTVLCCIVYWSCAQS